MQQIKKIWVIFWSKTVEHDVSITSAYWIMAWLKKNCNYEIYPIYITKKWNWVFDMKFSDINNFKNLWNYDNNEFNINFSKRGKFCFSQKNWALFSTQKVELDLVFVVVHWVNWEDWSVQWLLQLLEVPYVSTSLTWSSLWMNKIIMKDIFKSHELPITNFLTFTKDDINIEKITTTLKYPIFIKPSNLWSSIWISRVNNVDELKNAVEVAFFYDNEIIAEEWVTSLIELNCSVMEKDWEIITSLVEQPVSKEEFLSFDQKYTSVEGWTMQWAKNRVKIPAEISPELTLEIEEMTIKIYKILKLDWWCPRIDYLFDSENNKLYVNEINTIPWAYQMHLWVKSGFTVWEFLENLIKNSLSREKKTENLNYNFDSNIIDKTILFTK